MANEKAVYLVAIVAFLAFAIIIALTRTNMNVVHNTNTTTIPTVKSNFLSISASGTIENKSTQAQLYLVINGTGPTSSIAVQNLSNTLSQFNNTISKYINGNTSDIKTEYLNTFKIYNNSGYEAQEQLYVVIPNIGNTSTVIAALSSIPNVYVNGASPMLSDAQISSMRLQALTLALSNATEQARALIGSSQIISTNITVNNYQVVYPFPYANASISNVPSNNTNLTTQFYGGTNKVTESIVVQFSYIGNQSNYTSGRVTGGNPGGPCIGVNGGPCGAP
jgi:uncharacterized protein YggE